ncbi:MAG: hypothetical protein ABIK62_05835 [candidate division WOR-3 bacterium]
MLKRILVLVSATVSAGLAIDVTITWNQWPYGVRCIGDSFVWAMSPDGSHVTVPAFNPDDTLWDMVNVGGSALTRVAKSLIRPKSEAQGTPPTIATYAEKQIFSGQTSWGYEHMDTSGSTQYMWLYGFYAQGTQVNYDSPYQQVYRFPMRLGDNWQCNWTWNYMGMDEVSESRNNYVVAQGWVRVPADTLNWYPCCVIRTYSTTVDELGAINESRIIHEWVVPDAGRVGGSVVTIQSQNHETSPEFTDAEHVFRMKAYHSVFDNTPPSFANTTRLPSGYNLGPFVVASQISDPNGVSRDSLYFRIGSGSWQAVGHDSAQGGTYWFHIPALSGADSVRYYLVASDNSPARNRGTDPNGAPGNFFVFFARDPADDHNPPVITGTTQWTDTAFAGPFVVSANIVDSCAVDTVYLLYRFNAGSEIIAVPDSIRGSNYFLTIPEAGVNTFIRYRIRAVDGSPNHNVGYDPRTGNYSFNVVDASGPSFAQTTVWNDTTFGGPFPVRSRITDISGVQRALICFKLGSANWDSLPADSTRDSSYFMHIPSVVTPMSVRYFIKAIDNSQRHNAATDPTNAPNAYYEFYCDPLPAIEESEALSCALSARLASINPELLTFTLPSTGLVLIQVYDAKGSRCLSYSRSLPAGIHRCALPRLSNGSYVLEVRAPDGRVSQSFAFVH